MRTRINGTEVIERLNGAPSQVFSFPWPPTANKYWRHNRGRHHISKEGTRYREHVAVTLMLDGFRPMKMHRIGIHIQASPPDNRRRDLDNLHKALLDALQYAGLFDDDSQIDDLHIIRAQVTPVGRVIVKVCALELLNA